MIFLNVIIFVHVADNLPDVREKMKFAFFVLSLKYDAEIGNNNLANMIAVFCHK
jgi:hypothetical protein